MSLGLTRFKILRHEGDYISLMALDPELLPYLGGPATADMDNIAASRSLAASLNADAMSSRSPLPTGVSYRDTSVASATGVEVPLRVYSRNDLPRPCGALLFIHGGAFVFGDLEIEHDRCLYYAQMVNAVIVSVDYRLAPEFAYPAAHEDVWTALQWLIAHAAVLDVDPRRISVGGASAGGSLAAGIALRCRDEDGPSLAAQLLMYPVLDDRGATRSMELFHDYDPWDGNRSRKMWPLYLGHDGDAPVYAAPAREENLRGLPPTFVMSCEEDPLRDEDLSFALRLIDAGVSVELHHFPNTYHAFDVIAPDAGVARRALNEQVWFLQRVLGTPSV